MFELLARLCGSFSTKRRFARPPRRPRLETLEDRLTPSWSSVPPALISPPAGLPAIRLDGYGRAAGTGSITKNEVDFYRLVAPASGEYTLRAGAAGSLLDSVLGVYNASGGRIGYNNDAQPGDPASAVTLNLIAGRTYFVGITNFIGAAGGPYAWSIAGPSFDDGFEPNNTLATASPLGTFGPRTIGRLALLDDADFFRFTLPAVGKPGDAVSIAFTHADGNLDLELYNGTGALIGSSTSQGDGESVSLEGLPADTYFVKVVGFEGATSPSYSLTLTPPPTDDPYENNNTRATASDLGTPTGVHTLTGLRMGDSADWFRFTLGSNGTAGHAVSIAFTHADGDLDLELYNASGTRLAFSRSFGNGESISLAGRPAGTYFVRVYGFRGAFNPSYSLTLDMPPLDDAFEDNDTRATASILGRMRSAGTISGLSLYDPDWFRFTTVSAATVSIAFAHADGNLDLELYSAAGALLRSSASQSDGESVSLAGLPAGTYFVKVVGFEGATNPSYSLTISPPPPDDAYENNNTRATAWNLGKRTETRTISNLLLLDAADWYRFTTVNRGGPADAVSIAFSHADGDLNLELYSATGALIGVSASQGDGESISLTGRPAGTYFIKVVGFQGATNRGGYSLTITPPFADDRYENNDTRATATNLGRVTGPNMVSGLRMADDADWYRFVLAGPGTSDHSVTINFQHDRGNLDLELYNAAGELLAFSRGVVDQEEVSLDGLAAGTYFVRAYGHDGARNRSYTLFIRAPAAFGADDDYEDNDTRETAHDLGTLTETRIVSGLRMADAADWFRFTTTAIGMASSEVRITFPHFLGDLDLELYDEAGTYLAGSFGSDNSERVSLEGLPAGTYHVKVYGYNGAINSGYSLKVTPPAADDAFEDNDTQETAHDLGTRAGSPTTYAGLRLADDDWFRFTTTAAGTPASGVSIAFRHADGDLSLELYDAAGTLLVSSDTGDDGESVSLDGLAAGTYFVRVFGAFNPSYALTVTPPATAPDVWYAQNLMDPSLRELVQELNADGVITRDEMLLLFQQVRQDNTVSAAELADLRKLVANTTVIVMPGHVRNLTHKVVNTDRANARYRGTALGNLKAGAGGAHLQKLVNKWFLGLDRPNAGGAPYMEAAGELFAAGGPSYLDVVQGSVGDCYYLAVLASAAVQRPTALTEMFIDNGDGTYTVRFYRNGSAEYVTVDRYLPVLSGMLIYASYGRLASSASTVLWVALAEKAYAQLNESGWTGQSVAANSYAAIAGGNPAVVMDQLQDTGSAWKWLPGVTFEAIRARFDAGALVTFATRGLSEVASNVVPGHAYTMIDYDETNQTVRLYNPWGPEGGALAGTHRDGEVIVTLAQLLASFVEWEYTL